MSQRTFNIGRHATTQEHVENYNRQIETVGECVNEESTINEKAKVAELELIIAGMFSMFGWAFKNAPALVQHLQFMDPGCVWDNIRLGKTKCRDLIIHVIGKKEKERLTEILKTVHFSICFDESTDVTNDKNLAIQLRYSDPLTGHVVSQLWEMATIFKKGENAKAGSAEIFDSLKNSLNDCDIPLCNVLSYCTDGCATMIGANTGVKTRLEAEVPNIIVVLCADHILHNCAKHAMMVLPVEVLDLIKNIYSMLKSSNKAEDFKILQENLDLLIHKILRYVATRWLSMKEVIDRIIEQWKAIELFSEHLGLNNDHLGIKVFEMIKKKVSKLYFYSLQHILSKLTNLNLFFQRDDVVIHLAKNEIEKTFKSIVSCYLQRNYVNETALEDIDLFNESKYMPFIDFQLGEKVRQVFIENGAYMKDFCTVILNFIIVLALEMKTRFKNFQDDVLSAATCLDPFNALSLSFHKDFHQNFIKFTQVFGNIIEDTKQLNDQWNNLPLVFSCDESDLRNMRIEDFWFFVFCYQNEQPFQHLGSIFLVSCTTPHANAGPEQEFSDKKI